MSLRSLFISLFLLPAAFVSNAQKFGHINSAAIIDEHPAVNSANATLESFQKTLTDSFALKVKVFEDKYRAFIQEANSGALSQVALARKQAELSEEQQALATEEQQLKFRILQKREELLRPILAEIDAIIQAIGKEGNYSMIFDTSVGGALLFAEESEDLTPMVKTRCTSK